MQRSISGPSEIIDRVWTQPMKVPIPPSSEFLEIVVKGVFKLQFSDHLGMCESNRTVGEPIGPDIDPPGNR